MGSDRFQNKNDIFCTVYYFFTIHTHTQKAKHLTILLFYVFYTPRVTKLHCITKYNTTNRSKSKNYHIFRTDEGTQ